jgi:hypothetical protein
VSGYSQYVLEGQDVTQKDHNSPTNLAVLQAHMLHGSAYNDLTVELVARMLHLYDCSGAKQLIEYEEARQ